MSAGTHLENKKYILDNAKYTKKTQDLLLPSASWQMNPWRKRNLQKHSEEVKKQ